MDSSDNDVEMKDIDVDSTKTTPTSTPTSATTSTGKTPKTPTKRKKLTEEEKKKKEDDKKRLLEEREAEKKKREDDKKKREEEKKKKEEEKETEKKKREEEAEKRKEEKRKKEEERLKEKKKREEEAERKKEEIEKKRLEQEKAKEEELKKQPKLTQFFTPIQQPVRIKVNSNQFIQPIELPPHTELYQYQVPSYARSIESFKEAIGSQSYSNLPRDISSSNQEKKRYFSNIERVNPAKKGQRNIKFKMPIKSLPGAIMHHDLISKLSVLKLLKFHDNYRPSYYGTFSKRSKSITAKNPIKKDETIDYDYDSDDEWDEEKDLEGDVEKISSDNEKEEEEEEIEDEEDQAWIEKNDQNEEEEDDSIHTKKKKRRLEEKKPIILEPYFTKYPLSILKDQENNMDTTITTTTTTTAPSNNIDLEFLKIFTVQPLEPTPIKLEPIIIEKPTSSIKEDFPIKALPTLLYIIKNNKLPFKKLVQIFTKNFPHINQRQIKGKLNEHCIYSHRAWSIKPESEDIVNHPIDPQYPIPDIPKPTKETEIENDEEENNENINNSNSTTINTPSLHNNNSSGNNNNSSNINSNSLNKSPSKSPTKPTKASKKKQQPVAVQTNSLLNYFSKVESSPVVTKSEQPNSLTPAKTNADSNETSTATATTTNSTL
ncbi:hypothetical protein DICPUDRAFT_159600 [Dictyostelium purpureum]|uniref:Chromatin assembly factor 1 subunit A n=1 Tax=Dictyostelium purpureum TaxID=5786 RepID=F1A4I3_DICPU|nr:uncharacterized protein DICPUDRAFT_159600 [Dictyostelium purpureum]EGC28900.1 hypothetical protein DICPUDRAFT_159600 [Dictyostelium purpureum]|eukprot:XP_003294577.1 hypothetical protein DICPUDRAFT_159600 [Dictyostelium purpureum]